MLLRPPIDIKVCQILKVRYTDLRELPSGYYSGGSKVSKNTEKPVITCGAPNPKIEAHLGKEYEIINENVIDRWGNVTMVTTEEN